jgi:hypothetical protein
MGIIFDTDFPAASTIHHLQEIKFETELLEEGHVLWRSLPVHWHYGSSASSRKRPYVPARACSQSLHQL